MACLPKHKGPPTPETITATELLKKTRQEAATLSLGLKQLGDRNLTLVHQLVGSDTGGLTPLKALPGKGCLNAAAYAALFEEINKIPLETRAAMYKDDQPNVTTFFSPATNQDSSAHPPCPRDWNPVPLRIPDPLLPRRKKGGKGTRRARKKKP